MNRYPLDSADAAEQREAANEPPDPAPVHDLRCDAGWLGEDPAGRPIPCLRCRPHLAHTDRNRR